MFESVVVDPAAYALRRAALIFRVIAVLHMLGTILLATLALAKGRMIGPIALLFNVALAGVAWVTATGIENQKNWARWTGIALGILELFNFPIGTVIGVAVLIYLVRASRAGLFAAPQIPSPK
jgi:hypothetical protein